jgi:hypothetical protein
MEDLPNAKKPAERSSAITWVLILGFLLKAIVRAALREPGQITTSFKPKVEANSDNLNICFNNAIL